MYRASAKPTLTRSFVLERPSSFDRVASMGITMTSGAATCVLAQGSSLFAIGSGLFCLLAAGATTFAFGDRTITLVADRPARELRCTDTLHHLRPTTQSFAVDAVLSIGIRVIANSNDSGPPYAVEVRDPSAKSTTLARFGTRDAAENATVGATELLVWLRNEPGRTSD